MRADSGSSGRLIQLDYSVRRRASPGQSCSAKRGWVQVPSLLLQSISLRPVGVVVFGVEISGGVKLTLSRYRGSLRY